jgi:hypothetical protein
MEDAGYRADHYDLEWWQNDSQACKMHRRFIREEEKDERYRYGIVGYIGHDQYAVRKDPMDGISVREDVNCEELVEMSCFYGNFAFGMPHATEVVRNLAKDALWVVVNEMAKRLNAVDDYDNFTVAKYLRAFAILYHNIVPNYKNRMKHFDDMVCDEYTKTLWLPNDFRANVPEQFVKAIDLIPGKFKLNTDNQTLVTMSDAPKVAVADIVVDKVDVSNGTMIMTLSDGSKMEVPMIENTLEATDNVNSTTAKLICTSQNNCIDISASDSCGKSIREMLEENQETKRANELLLAMHMRELTKEELEELRRLTGLKLLSENNLPWCELRAEQKKADKRQPKESPIDYKDRDKKLPEKAKKTTETPKRKHYR